MISNKFHHWLRDADFIPHSHRISNVQILGKLLTFLELSFFLGSLLSLLSHLIDTAS